MPDVSLGEDTNSCSKCGITEAEIGLSDEASVGTGRQPWIVRFSSAARNSIVRLAAARLTGSTGRNAIPIA